MHIHLTQTPGNSLAKDIMHVWTVVGTSAKPGDVELAQLLLFGQLDVMAEVTVVTLMRNNKKVFLTNPAHLCSGMR